MTSYISLDSFHSGGEGQGEGEKEREREQARVGMRALNMAPSERWVIDCGRSSTALGSLSLLARCVRSK